MRLRLIATAQRSADWLWSRRGIAGVALVRTCRLAFYFVVWCWLLTWVVDSGLLWTAVRPRLAVVEPYAAQDALIRGRDQMVRDVLLVGDPMFLKTAREALPAGVTTLEIPISTVDMYDIVKALRMTRLSPPGEADGYRFRTTVLQMSPHYFSDVMWRGPWDDYDYWETMAEKDKNPWLPNAATLRFFETLEAWASSDPVANPVETNRPPPIERRFVHDANPAHLKAFIAAIRYLETPTILVTDLRAMDFSAARPILDRYMTEVVPALAAHPQIGTLARWTDLDSLGSAVQGTE